MLSLWLLALHMLGDYILQNDWMAANKFKSHIVRTVHVLAYTAPFVFLAGCYQRDASKGIAFIILLFVTHWITDCRRWASGEKWCAKPIMVDQTIHILTLAVLGQLFLVT